MDILEKINRSFGTWYEGLFGGGDDVRPKDILRRILAGLEDHRKEGFDNRTYVPNQYILEVSVSDEEEKEYLLSFLDREELEAAVKRYCKQNNYHIKGVLDFTIRDVPQDELEQGKKREKVRVVCRYNTKTGRLEGGLPPLAVVEDRTIAGRSAYDLAEESGTVPSVAAATLAIYAPDKSPTRYPISKAKVKIGRSLKMGNDIVLDTDGQVSKEHARIDMEAQGQFTIVDMHSTNGVKVNGKRIESRRLNHEDEIMIGATRLVFHLADGDEQLLPIDASAKDQIKHNAELGSSTPPARVLRSRTARLVLMEDAEVVDDFILASETLVGRGTTCDIVLPDRSISAKHALLLHDGDGGYTLETLEDAPTTLNGATLLTGISSPLREGDSIRFGHVEMRFEGGK